MIYKLKLQPELSVCRWVLLSKISNLSDMEAMSIFNIQSVALVVLREVVVKFL